MAGVDVIISDADFPDIKEVDLKLIELGRSLQGKIVTNDFNLNKVALLRNQRDVGYPSVLEAARMVAAAGAHGLTVHPRPDERHIRRSDVLEVAALIAHLVGPDAGFITGATYNINGGVRIG